MTLTVGASASAQLMEADFTGGTLTLCGTTFDCSTRAPFAGLITRSANVLGSFIFDQSRIPPTGTMNVPLPLDAGEDPLQLVLGTGPQALVFTAAMGLSGNLVQVQYRNGHFNGFAYFSAFMFGGHEYQLDVQGTLWSIYDRAGGIENFSNLAASGYLNTTLTNVRPYVGVTATPEPASLVLLATGLAGVIGVARRRRLS